MEPGVPLLLAPGPALGLLRGHLAGETPTLPGPLLLPHRVCPDLGAPLPAPPPRLAALRSAGLHHLGSPAGRPPAVPVHIPQVSVELGEEVHLRHHCQPLSQTFGASIKPYGFDSIIVLPIYPPFQHLIPLKCLNIIHPAWN